MPRQSEEDYLKTIYELQTEHHDATSITNSLVAERMQVSAASATNMIKRLAESGHVQHIPYKGVRLTESGKNNALKVVRRHRLLELYLYSELGFSWDKVHEEAERLEHVISEEFEQKIDEKMGFPTLDPHGAPIPDGNGECGPRPVLSLMELRVGQRGTVQAVTDKDPAMLRFMDSIGMGLGTHVEVVKKEPFGGSIIVKIDAEAEEPIGSRLAKEVFIQIQDPVEA